MDSGLDPLHWKGLHLAEWAALMVAGGVGGIVFGFFISPFSTVAGADTMTMALAWLRYPGAWWPWSLAGAVTAGLAYYAAVLLTGAR